MAALTSKSHLQHSNEQYDWLGPGIYFWENDPKRALEWAEKKSIRGSYKHPFVIGAVIDLGNCLDLISRTEMTALSMAYASLKKEFDTSGRDLPHNRDAKGDGNGDKLLRELDCAVIKHLHVLIDELPPSPELKPYDTVRGLFPEGDEAYPGARFLLDTHTQIAVRTHSCIKGYFLPPSLNQLCED